MCLIRHILKCEPEEASAIISNRLGDVNWSSAWDAGTDSIMKLDEAAQCLDKNDEADLRKHQKAKKKEAEDLDGNNSGSPGL